MRIRTFCKYLDVEEVKSHTLKNCTVVVDAQNFFYNLYEKSGLPSVYGCEGDKYARYLRKYLSMFKKANIKCYFLFKGGHLDINYKFKKLEDKWTTDWSTEHYFAQPVCMKELYKQILDEMGFDYAICEYEAKAEVIAFARKHNCPIISYDIEFSFSGLPYIPYSTFLWSDGSDGVECGLFNLKNFLAKFRLNNEKLAIFIALTDEQIFGEDFFQLLFESLNMPKGPYKRNICLLKWLGRLSEHEALKIIYQYVPERDFTEKFPKAKQYINVQASTGIPTKYLENNKKIEIVELDPNWFEKGVAVGSIAINYVNLYRSNIYFGAWTIEDDNDEDSLLLSLDIITYAFNLLSNFDKSEFMFHDKNDNKRTVPTNSIRKPNYEAVTSPFENGWDRVRDLRLFEHFLEEKMPGFNYEALQKAPADARLLILALVYFSREKTIDTSNIVCSVLLSYVMLGVVFDKLPDNDASDIKITKNPYLDSTTDKELVITRDCAIAYKILQQYFHITKYDSIKIFEPKLIHPFVEFQHCFVQMNNLNKLCGSSYNPTEYSKTFNGTFVYKFIYEAKRENVSAVDLAKKLLNPAATVLSFFNGLYELYQEIMYR